MSKFSDTHEYDDIIGLAHHVSKKWTRMSMTDRGAQFSPFAALVGYDAAIQETARLTGCRTELTEGEKMILNEKMQWILSYIHLQPRVAVTYFVPDARKEGGEYVRTVGKLKKIDPYGQNLLLADGKAIPFDDIIGIETELPEP